MQQKEYFDCLGLDFEKKICKIKVITLYIYGDLTDKNLSLSSI